MAEIEFSVVARACLRGRNPDGKALHRSIRVYDAERNEAAAFNWRFATKEARAKLRRLCPDTSVLTIFYGPAWSQPPESNTFRHRRALVSTGYDNHDSLETGLKYLFVPSCRRI